MYSRVANRLEQVFPPMVRTYQKLWRKDITKSCIGRDFYNFSRYIYIQKELTTENVDLGYEEVDFKNRDKKDPKEHIVDILNTLAEIFNDYQEFDIGVDEEPLTTVDELKRNVPNLKNFTTFTNFLNKKYDGKKKPKEGEDPQESLVIKLIKFTHKGYVALLLGELSQILDKRLKVRFKDSFIPDLKIIFQFGKKENYPFVKVIHKRTEQMMKVSNRKTTLFSFRWQLEFKFNSYKLERIEDCKAKTLSFLMKEPHDELEKEFNEIFPKEDRMKPHKLHYDYLGRKIMEYERKSKQNRKRIRFKNTCPVVVCFLLLVMIMLLFVIFFTAGENDENFVDVFIKFLKILVHGRV